MYSNRTGVQYRCVPHLRVVDHGGEDAGGASVQRPGDEGRGVVAHADDGEAGGELLQPRDGLEGRPLVQEAVLLVDEDCSEPERPVLLSH